ncbi:MAG: DUF2807 domain-containing protein [Prevotellaceae bacterium]|nr:DUF2807 domain-containing protein [Prevotellaceae bacterium]
MKKKILVASALLGFCACATAKDAVVENRPVGAFTKIESDGVCNIRLAQGSTNAVTVEANPELQPEVKVECVDGTLKISTSKKFSGKDKTCKISITYTTLRAVNFRGVGDVKTRTPVTSDSFNIAFNGVGKVELELQSRYVKAVINGVGNVELEGKTDVLHVSKQGVGKLDAKGLRSEITSISNSGVGNASVHASKELTLSNSGVGALTYYGNAVIKSVDSSGIGRVKKGDDDDD